MHTIQRLKNLLTITGLNGFVGCIVSVIFLAWLYPAPGVAEKPFSIDDISNIGLCFVFFFYGLKLNRKAIKTGLTNWRMHLVIQSVTFILFPAIVLMIKPFINKDHEIFWLACFYVATLPSTVSSSVVMVSIAGGNIPAAIFNASISSILGVFLTPLWLSFFIDTQNGDLNVSSIIFRLFFQVLVPVIAGFFLNRYFEKWTEKNKKRLTYFDQFVILLIIYSSFCHSFSEKLFSAYSWKTLLLLILIMTALFFIVFFIIRIINRLFHFNLYDSITILFCGSKKSLIHGTVMSKVLFAGSSSAGFILLPLMLYHALQLFYAGIIAKRMSQSGAGITPADPSHN